MNPGEMQRIDAIDGVSLNDAVFPYLQSVAASALRKAALKKPGLQVNSALRALPQQYMLYRWSLRRRCGVERAATPGTSQHESGLAVDLQNWSPMRSTMEQSDYDWFGYSDNVHFTFKGQGASDIKGESILAFVRLWNRNHPTDKLPADLQSYTNALALRLMKAPANGFAEGPMCEPAL